MNEILEAFKSGRFLFVSERLINILWRGY